MGQQWCVLNPDTPFLDRRNQVVLSIAFPPENGREQLYRGLPGDGLTFEGPLAITGDHQIHIAGKFGVPFIQRWQIPALAGVLEGFGNVIGCPVHRFLPDQSPRIHSSRKGTAPGWVMAMFTCCSRRSLSRPNVPLSTR